MLHLQSNHLGSPLSTSSARVQTQLLELLLQSLSRPHQSLLLPLSMRWAAHHQVTLQCCLRCSLFETQLLLFLLAQTDVQHCSGTGVGTLQVRVQFQALLRFLRRLPSLAYCSQM